MGHTVVVAEKPSVGRDIARVLKCNQRGQGCLMNDQWVVTWAVGHLVTLVEPDELDERMQEYQQLLHMLLAAFMIAITLRIPMK